MNPLKLNQFGLNQFGLNQSRPNQQRGFVLVVSLIFLVVMTLLATSAIRKNILDEKLVGNLRSQNLAFQAAERGLRFCEAAVDFRMGSTTMCQVRPANTIPVLESSLQPMAWSQANAWSTATTVSGNSVMQGVAAQPQCILERWNVPTNNNESGSYVQFPVWVITARGVGNVANAVVVLQETVRCGSI
jgi:type IV pilus assembly protein PilX